MTTPQNIGGRAKKIQNKQLIGENISILISNPFTYTAGQLAVFKERGKEVHRHEENSKQRDPICVPLTLSSSLSKSHQY